METEIIKHASDQHLLWEQLKTYLL